MVRNDPGGSSRPWVIAPALWRDPSCRADGGEEGAGSFCHLAASTGGADDPAVTSGYRASYSTQNNQMGRQFNGGVNSGGFNCGVAIRDGCDRYVVDRCSGTLVMRQYPGSSDGHQHPQALSEFSE